MKNVKKLLFDLDGTLTEPRQKISKDMQDELANLLASGYEIGIVTGSGKDYIEEQIPIFNWNLSLHPCNGTQTYEMVMIDGEPGWNLTNSIELSKKERDVITTILKELLPKIQEELSDFIPSGDIIQERTSTINFCPIGRKATQEIRNRFEEFDKKTGFRNRWLQIIREGVGPLWTVVLGGVTSFDIFPVGWDKSYSLKHFQRKIHETSGTILAEGVIYFGNAFFKDGNDECMLNQDGVICINVKNPQDTLNILKSFL